MSDDTKGLVTRLRRYAQTWYDGGAFTTRGHESKMCADISAAADALAGKRAAQVPPREPRMINATDDAVFYPPPSDAAPPAPPDQAQVPRHEPTWERPVSLERCELPQAFNRAIADLAQIYGLLQEGRYEDAEDYCLASADSYTQEQSNDGTIQK